MLTWSLTTPFHRSAITPWNCRDVADGSAVVWGSVPGPDVLGVVVDSAVVVVERDPAVAVVERDPAVAVERDPAVAVVEWDPAVAVEPDPAVVVVGPCWCTLEVAARGAGEGRAPYAT